MTATEPTQIQQFLASFNELAERNEKANNTQPHTINGYRSIMDFVARNGRSFEPTNTLPNNVRRGIPRQCFANAARLVMRRPGFIYCEGYGLTLIPVMHAWVIDGNGRVIDPTWTGQTIASEYFGIAICTDFLRRTLAEQKHFGLIDAWESGYPMIEAPVSAWRHPIMDELP